MNSLRLRPIDEADIKPLVRNLYYKNCICCGRENVPFEQKDWVECLKCSIESKIHFLTNNAAAHSRSRAQKVLDILREQLCIVAFSEFWQETKNAESYGYIDIIYKDKPEMKGFIGIRITARGKQVLNATKEPKKTS